MLVDINLLPKKQSRNITTHVVVAICLLFAIFTFSSLALFHHFIQKDMKLAGTELSAVQQIRTIKEEQQARPQQASSSASQLQSAVEWADQNTINMVPLINHLVSLLPERGFVQNISYSLNGSVNLSVQFDQSRDAAYYLHHLHLSPHVLDVQLSSISTNSAQSEEEALPRYLTQYSITLDKGYAKAEQMRGGQ